MYPPGGGGSEGGGVKSTTNRDSKLSPKLFLGLAVHVPPVPEAVAFGWQVTDIYLGRDYLGRRCPGHDDGIG